MSYARRRAKPIGAHTAAALVRNLKAGTEGYATQAGTWHDLADQLAPYSPRVAAVLRDQARALDDLAYMCAGLRPEEWDP